MSSSKVTVVFFSPLLHSKAKKRVQTQTSVLLDNLPVQLQPHLHHPEPELINTLESILLNSPISFSTPSLSFTQRTVQLTIYSHFHVCMSLCLLIQSDHPIRTPPLPVHPCIYMFPVAQVLQIPPVQCPTQV